MKKLFLVPIAAMMLFACKKADSVRELPGDTEVQTLPGDPELFNPEMDAKAAAMRKYPPKNPHNQPPPPPPPPTTQKIGCIKIDTDGEDVSNTLWSAETLVCASSGLSDAQIQDAVTRAKNYFSGVQDILEITTSESVFNTYPVGKRIRVALTTTTFFGNVGGVAYINSFNWFDDTPCFVFPGLLGYNTKYIADAIAHEAGHTFGCRHHSDWIFYEDGTCFKNNEYLWADDIMGASYYAASPLFKNAPANFDCHTLENSPLVITNSINQ